MFNKKVKIIKKWNLVWEEYLEENKFIFLLLNHSQLRNKKIHDVITPNHIVFIDTEGDKWDFYRFTFGEFVKGDSWDIFQEDMYLYNLEESHPETQLMRDFCWKALYRELEEYQSRRKNHEFKK